MKLLCVIVAILATTAAKDTREAKSAEEDLQALPSDQLSQTAEIPASSSNTERGSLKYWNQPQSRYYYPSQNNYAPPQNNYVPPQNNYVPPQNNYVPQNTYAPPQNTYVPPQNTYAPPTNNYYTTTQKPYVSTQNYYWTTQAPYIPTQSTYVTPKPQYTYPAQQNQVWTTAAPAVSVIKNEHYTGDNGSYRYEYQLTNGVHVGEEGYVLNPNTDNQIPVKKGWYSYIGADGYTYLVTYWADHTGYHPTYKRYYQQ